ncbi:MAG: transposase [Bacteroidales bacterium]|nr:transposase [Bacteroidales bacterium]
MSQSLCKIYLHVIFHIKNTSPNVAEEHLPRLHSYIAQLINANGCKTIIVGGTDNHVHALLLFSRNITIAHLVEEIKRNSSRWIKTIANRYGCFGWQGGYAAFSVSQSVVDKTIEYINHQQEHHKKHSFKEEYLEFLKLYNILFDERYVFED